MVYSDNILITGATGLVGRHLIRLIQQTSPHTKIYAASSRLDALNRLFHPSDTLRFAPNADVLGGRLPKAAYETTVHAAFTRKNEGPAVVSSLDFTCQLYSACKTNGTKRLINLSSRSVYQEPALGTLNTEDSPISGSSVVGLGKYASELLTNSFFAGSDVRYTNLRLASVNELKTEETMVRPLNVFVDCMLQGKPIHVVGGMQVMSYIDPRDVATAILALLSPDCSAWQPVYNIGTGWMCTEPLLEMARRVVSIGCRQFQLPAVAIDIEEKQVRMTAGLDIQRIQQDTHWSPCITLDSMITALYQMKLSQMEQGK